MDFLVGIHIKDYNGTSNSRGKNDFKMTGIKVLTLPEMCFYDIMFEDYIGYSNEELYSLLDSIKGWKYSSRLYRHNGTLYLSYCQCNTLHYGGVSLFNYSDCIPLFCDGKLLNSKDNKLKITQSSDADLLNIVIYVNLTSYEIGVFVDGHCIFGNINFKSLYYDCEDNSIDKLRDSYTKSFLEIYSTGNPYFIDDIVPVEHIDSGISVVGSKCLLDMSISHSGKTIIIPNEIKELILSVDDNKLSTEDIIVFPPSIDRLLLLSDQIFSYSVINIKLIFAEKSDISNILYYLYQCVYDIPKYLRDTTESKMVSGDNLSYKDKMLNYIKNNKDDMVKLLGRLGLSISFYG